MVKNSQGKAGYRSFTVVEVGKHGGCKTKFHGGRYVGRNAVGAARKAFNDFCRVKRIKGVCAMVVTVKETTAGSKGKVFSYKLNRRKLAEPIIRLEGTKNEFVVEYGVTAKSTTVPVACRTPGQTRGRMKKRTAKKNKKSANNVRRMRKRVNNLPVAKRTRAQTKKRRGLLGGLFK